MEASPHPGEVRRRRRRLATSSRGWPPGAHALAHRRPAGPLVEMAKKGAVRLDSSSDSPDSLRSAWGGRGTRAMNARTLMRLLAYTIATAQQSTPRYEPHGQPHSPSHSASRAAVSPGILRQRAGPTRPLPFVPGSSRRCQRRSQSTRRPSPARLLSLALGSKRQPFLRAVRCLSFCMGRSQGRSFA